MKTIKEKIKECFFKKDGGKHYVTKKRLEKFNLYEELMESEETKDFPDFERKVYFLLYDGKSSYCPYCGKANELKPRKENPYGFASCHMACKKGKYIPPNRKEVNEKRIIELYQEGNSLEKIAELVSKEDEVSISRIVVNRVLEEHNINKRSKSEAQTIVNNRRKEVK